MEQTSNENIPKEIPLTEIEEQTRIGLLLKGKSCKKKEEEINNETEIFENHIELKNELTESMMKISLLLKSIPNYNLYFQPILNVENIQYGKITEDNIESCQTIPLKRNTNIGELITLKLRKYEIRWMDHVRNLFSFEKKVQTCIEVWFQTMTILKKLKEKNIIHMNIHNQTLLYSEEKGRPILSGYNMAFDVSEYMDVQSDWEKYFPNFEEHAPWCIDIYLLSKLADRKEMNATGPIEREEMLRWCEEYVNHEQSVYSKLGNIEKRQEYLKQIDAHFMTYQTHQSLFEYLIKNAHTWDVYSVCNLFLDTTKEIIPTSNPNPTLNTSVEKMIEILKNFLYAMPNARPAIEELEKSISNIYMQQAPVQVQPQIQEPEQKQEPEQTKME